jgi:hypothetical protein
MTPNYSLGYRPVNTSANRDYVREPKWTYQEGESVLYEPRRVEDHEHHGLQCGIERQLVGYLDGKGGAVDTRGGAYYVRFGCGCATIAMEHELRRHGERARIQ